MKTRRFLFEKNVLVICRAVFMKRERGIDGIPYRFRYCVCYTQKELS